MSVLGNRIKLRRTKMNFTQDELAELLQTDQKQISKYETGKQSPSADVLVNLSIFLKTTTDYLVGLSEVEERPLRDERDLTPREKEIIKAYRSGNFKDMMIYIVTGEDKATV